MQPLQINVTECFILLLPELKIDIIWSIFFANVFDLNYIYYWYILPEQIGQQNIAFGIKFNAKGIVDCYEKELETLPTGIKREIEFKMIEGDFQLFEGKWSILQVGINMLPWFQKSSGSRIIYRINLHNMRHFIINIVQRSNFSFLRLMLWNSACIINGWPSLAKN